MRALPTRRQNFHSTREGNLEQSRLIIFTPFGFDLIELSKKESIKLVTCFKSCLDSKTHHSCDVCEMFSIDLIFPSLKLCIVFFQDVPRLAAGTNMLQSNMLQYPQGFHPMNQTLAEFYDSRRLIQSNPNEPLTPHETAVLYHGGGNSLSATLQRPAGVGATYQTPLGTTVMSSFTNRFPKSSTNGFY